MMDLNIADVFIISLIAISTLIGVYRGFLREFLTILTWIIASILAYMFGQTAGKYFVFVENAASKQMLGILSVFFGVLIIGFILKLILFKALKITFISPVDRTLGAVFGALRGALLIILVLLVATTNINEQPWYKKSQLLPYFVQATDVVANSIPKSWKDDFKHEMEDMQKKLPTLMHEVKPTNEQTTPETTTPATTTTTTTPATTTPTTTTTPATTTPTAAPPPTTTPSSEPATSSTPVTAPTKPDTKH